MIKGKKLFITGGAGFIGASLIKLLLDDNEIIVYDSLSRNALKDSGLWNHPNLKVIQGNVLDYEFLEKSVPKDIDLFLHMAAIAGIDTVIKDPVKTLKVNMIGTYHVLKVLRELKLLDKIERFINFSTSEVFGIHTFRADEKTPTNLQPVGEARWTYSVGKLAGEYLTYSYYKQFGLRAVIIRPFNVYGPGQVGEGAIHHFVVRAIKGEPLVIHGDGDQIRSWCYIDDMVAGILLCLEKEEAIGEVFNIGNPKGTITILGLAEKVIQLAQSPSRIVHVLKTYVDVELRIPNIEKARNLLGFEPKYGSQRRDQKNNRMVQEQDRSSMTEKIRLYKPYLGDKQSLMRLLEAVLDSGFLVQGKYVAQFEQEVAAYLGVEHAIAVSSGTAALHLSLIALGVGPGDEVIVPAYTFPATANVVELVGAKPTLVDVDVDTYNIQVERIKEAISPKTKAIIPVHLFGNPADMDPLMEIAIANNLVVIEDAAGALSSVYKGKKCGTIGHLGCFSFHPRKIITTGEGGMVVTNDGALAEKVDIQRRQGGKKKYHAEVLDFNSRLDTLQAAILGVELKYLDTWNEVRRQVAKRYNELLDGLPVITPYESPDVYHVHQYTIRVEQQDALATYLKERGIGTMVYYPVFLHLQGLYADLGYGKGSLPASEAASREVLSQPIYSELNEAQQKKSPRLSQEFYRAWKGGRSAKH